MSPPDPDRLVCIAAVAAAHGIHGLLKLRCFTAEPGNVAAYGPVMDERGNELFTLTVLRPVQGGVIARASGITDRTTAEALRGRRLHVPRARLPQPEEDEFYQDDLIGLLAVDPVGAPLGRVRAVHDFGAGDVLELEGEAGAAEMIPFTREVVPTVDLGAGRIVVLRPAEAVAEHAP